MTWNTKCRNLWLLKFDHPVIIIPFFKGVSIWLYRIVSEFHLHYMLLNYYCILLAMYAHKGLWLMLPENLRDNMKKFIIFHLTKYCIKFIYLGRFTPTIHKLSKTYWFVFSSNCWNPLRKRLSRKRNLWKTGNFSLSVLRISCCRLN